MAGRTLVLFLNCDCIGPNRRFPLLVGELAAPLMPTREGPRRRAGSSLQPI